MEVFCPLQNRGTFKTALASVASSQWAPNDIHIGGLHTVGFFDCMVMAHGSTSQRCAWTPID